MNKSILIIDTPKNCEVCPFYDEEIFRSCWAYLHFTSRVVIDKCPLKQMPEKKENYEGFNDIDLEWQADSYCEGWNNCIDEITGEDI